MTSEKKSKKEYLEESQNKMIEGIKSVLNSDGWKNYLKVQSRFHRYSFNNSIMIACQCPEATRVAGYKTWQQLNRQVIKGSKAIKIFAPMMKTVEKEVLKGNGKVEVEKTKVLTGYTLANVFDISMTSGEELPNICRDIQGDSEEAKILFEVLKSTIDIPVLDKDMGYNGYFDPKKLEIAVRSDLSHHHKLKTLIHEDAHYLIHKAKKDGLELAKYSLDGEDYNALYAVEEIIVESIAFITCSYFGINTSDYSFEYVSSWSEGDINQIKEVGTLIQKYSKQFIETLEKALTGVILEETTSEEEEELAAV